MDTGLQNFLSDQASFKLLPTEAKFVITIMAPSFTAKTQGFCAIGVCLTLWVTAWGILVSVCVAESINTLSPSIFIRTMFKMNITLPVLMTRYTMVPFRMAANSLASPPIAEIGILVVSVTVGDRGQILSCVCHTTCTVSFIAPELFRHPIALLAIVASVQLIIGVTE